MIDALWTTQPNRLSAESDLRRGRVYWLLFYLGLIGFSLVLGLLMLLFTPGLKDIAWIVYLTGVVAILYRPRYGLYLILFLSLVGDSHVIPWFPFAKNFSSAESLLYVNDAIIISPLESYLGLTLLAWLGRGAMQRKIQFFTSELFWPGMLFAVFAVVGLAYGVGTGGNLNIGLWEARPLFYMVLMLVLASNLLTERSHFSHLMWAAMLAIFVESAAGVHHFVVDLGMSLAGVESVTEHAAAIHMNTLFVYILAVWLFKASAVKRLVLPLMVPFVGVTYLITQRRAAFVTLALALMLFAIVLFMENRKIFWIVVPPMAVIAMLYTGAFWNNTGTLGIPAQAIKSVIAEDQASAADASSNIYRIIENLNTSFTIHQKPLTGVGFGQKFYIVVPMPDISFFEWWEYLPHNSIIWVWLKMGVGGFVATVALIGLSIMVGMRAFLRMPKNDLAAIALTAVLYLIMHFTFAYVDISWDTQSMVYVGTVMGMLSCMERVVAKPVPPKPKRWPWQSAEIDAAPIRSLN